MAYKRNYQPAAQEHPTLDPYHSFLKSLVGQEVQVYRGGPESKQGKLMDVQSDYICLLANNNNNNKNGNNNQNQANQANQDNAQNNQQQQTVVYYRTQHLQSISENTKSNSMPKFESAAENNAVDFKRGYSFEEMLQSLVGSNVQINLGGPESKKGQLLQISGNYVAILTEDDGVVFFNIHHMKSITEQNNNNQNQGNENTVQIPEYIRADSFHDLFGQMSHKWVSINRGGPEALEGVLVQGVGGHYTLVNNDEVLRINPYHIKSISTGPKGALKQNTSNNSNQENESNDSSAIAAENSSDSMDTGSSKSSGKKSRRSSHRSHGDYSHEKVLKTYDYIWKPR